MVKTGFRITKKQYEFISSKDNASEYIRNLLDREIEKESDLKTEERKILDRLNFKTAVMMVMLNELVRSQSSINKGSWENQNITDGYNMTKLLSDAMDHYSVLL